MQEYYLDYDLPCEDEIVKELPEDLMNWWDDQLEIMSDLSSMMGGAA